MLHPSIRKHTRRAIFQIEEPTTIYPKNNDPLATSERAKINSHRHQAINGFIPMSTADSGNIPESANPSLNRLLKKHRAAPSCVAKRLKMLIYSNVNSAFSPICALSDICRTLFQQPVKLLHHESDQSISRICSRFFRSARPSARLSPAHAR